MATIHHLNCGTMCPYGERFVAGEGGLGSAKIVCHCLLIEASDSLVLIDTGLGVEDNRHRYRRLGVPFTAVFRPTADLAETALERIRAAIASPARSTANGRRASTPIQLRGTRRERRGKPRRSFFARGRAASVHRRLPALCRRPYLALKPGISNRTRSMAGCSGPAPSRGGRSACATAKRSTARASEAA